LKITRERDGWNKQGSGDFPGKPPLALIQDCYGRNRHCPASQSLARWLDHCYMGIDSETEQQVWISEPYGILPDAERDFAMLREAGFKVDVDPTGVEKRHSDRVHVVLIRRA
jgi:hypothetical protein